MKEGIFSANGVNLRTLTWENDESTDAPLVLLHGFSQSADAWYEVASLLAAQGRAVFAYDMVGHGGSDRPDSADAYALDAQAQTFMAFLDKVVSDCQKKPVVLGYSMGGRVILTAAYQNPQAFADRVSALMLESAGLGPKTLEERALAGQRDAQNAALLRKEGVAAFMSAWEQLPLFATQQQLSPMERERVRASRLMNNAEALARTFEFAGQHAMPGYSEVIDTLCALANKGVALYYFVGELDEKYHAIADELAAAEVPNLMVLPIRNAGHNTHLEALASFWEALQKCLDAHTVDIKR